MATADLSGGYVNDVARELLLGVRLSPVEERDEAHAMQQREGDWIEDGVWIAASPASPDRQWTWHGAPFFRPAPDSPPNPVPEATATPHHETRSGSSSGGDGRMPSITEHVATVPGAWPPVKMTVTNILQRSVDLSRMRRRRRQTRLTPTSPADATTSTESASPARPSGTTPRKPYRVYDRTFSQRILDPLEPLLESCVRRGEDATGPLGDGASTGAGGLVVGIEVELSDAAASRATAVPTWSMASGVVTAAESLDGGTFDVAWSKCEARRFLNRMAPIWVVCWSCEM